MGEEAPHATNKEGDVHTSADMECVGHTSADVECADDTAAHEVGSANEKGGVMSANEAGSANEAANEEGDLMLPLVAKGGALLKVHFLKDHEVHPGLNLEVGHNL